MGPGRSDEVKTLSIGNVAGSSLLYPCTTWVLSPWIFPWNSLSENLYIVAVSDHFGDFVRTAKRCVFLGLMMAEKPKTFSLCNI